MKGWVVDEATVVAREDERGIYGIWLLSNETAAISLSNGIDEDGGIIDLDVEWFKLESKKNKLSFNSKQKWQLTEHRKNIGRSKRF